MPSKRQKSRRKRQERGRQRAISFAPQPSSEQNDLLQNEYKELAQHLAAAKKLDAKKMRRLFPVACNEVLKGGRITCNIISEGVEKCFAELMAPQGESEYITEMMTYDLARLIAGLQKGEVPEDPIIREALEELKVELKKAWESENRPKERYHLEGFSKKLVDKQCLKWADTLAEDEKGTFFSRCPVYNKSGEYIYSLINSQMEEHSNHLYIEKHKVYNKVSRAIRGVRDGLDQLDATCWECNTLCHESVNTCTACGIAKYCGKECQRKAWCSGHKKRCAGLPDRLDSLAESYGLIDSVHHGGTGPWQEFQNLELNEWADNKLLNLAQLSSAEMSLGGPEDLKIYEIPDLKGPSIRYFYENMRRMQVDGWWILQETGHVLETVLHHIEEDGVQDCQTWKASNESFLQIVCWLFYDLVGYFSPSTREERQQKDPATYFLFSSFVCSICLDSMVKGEPWTPRKIIEHYMGWARNTFITTKDWERERCEIRKLTMGADFRKLYHK